MKAAIRDRYGSPDVVEVREVERPTPKDDEILVRVRAASVNRADLDASALGRGSCACSWGARAAGSADGDRCRRRGRVRRGGRDALPAGRPGLRGRVLVRAGRVRRVRLCEGEGVPVDAGRDVLRGCRDPPAFGDPRAPGASTPQRADGPARRQGPDRRRLGQRRAVRRPDREVLRGRGDRRVQHRQGRFRALARRGPRARLHRGGLHEDRRALRLDPRHRLSPLAS